MAKAKALKSDIAIFLQSLKLTLSEEKTLITNTRRGRVKFLGTLIYKLTPTRGSLSHPTTAVLFGWTLLSRYLLTASEPRNSENPPKRGQKPLGSETGPVDP